MAIQITKRFLIPLTHHSAFSKRLVIGQKIWYHTGGKEEGESGVSSHSLAPPQPVWTRVERIQHLAVYGEGLEETASIRWHVTSHHAPIAGLVPVGHAAGKEHALEAVLLC